jgi:hypothetical protein
MAQAAASGRSIRGLLEGAPQYRDSHQRQWDNVEQFVREHLAELAAVPYEPEVSMPMPALPSKATTVKPSRAVPGIMGTFLDEPIQRHQQSDHSAATRPAPHAAEAAAAAEALSDRPPTRAAALAAAAKLQQIGPTGNNFPAPGSATHGPQYRPANPDRALELNCAQLGVAVRASRIAMAGRGLFNGPRARAKGELVAYVFGKFLLEEQWSSLLHRGVDPSHREGEEDFAELARRGVFCAVTVPQQPSGATILLMSRQSPAMLINHAQPPRANVSLDAPSHSYDPLRQPHQCRYFGVYTTGPVAPEEELLADYGWQSGVWQLARRRATVSLSSPPPPTDECDTPPLQ